MKTLFVSFYSDIFPSTFYKDSALKLKNRIEQLGGRIWIQELPPNNYQTNCLRKPKYILDCLRMFNEPVIWIDADSIVNELPVELDDIGVDVACIVKANGCPESALIYFNNTSKSEEFICRWIDGCNTDVPELDHPVLKDMWYGQSLETRKSLMDNICSVRSDSKVTIVLSKTEGKQKHTKDVINRRQKEGKIL